MKKSTLFSYFLFLLAFTALSFKPQAATLYWVDGIGMWNDANHWSAHSGGSGGAGVPGINDDVIFDLHSFQVPNETVGVPNTASCRNMTWESDVYSPIFDGSNSSSLDIYGSLSLAINMQWNYSGTINFKSSVNGNVISTYGKTLACNASFNGNGSWQLNGFLMLSPSSTLSITQGSLHAYGNAIQCGILNITGTNKKLLDICNSVLFIKTQIDSLSATNFKLLSGNSHIYYKSYSSVNSFKPLNAVAKPPFITNPFIDTIVTRPSCNCGDTAGTAGAGKCCNGKIKIDSLHSNAGGSPFKYSWSTGATVDSIVGVCASLGTVSCTITDTTDLSSQTIIINVAIPAINFSKETSKPPTCFGECNGWIIMNFIGGTPKYSYVWNSGAPGSGSNIPANTNIIDSSLCAPTNPTFYNVTVTDAHKCKTIFNFPLAQTKVVVATITSTPVSCDTACNGTATATASGGHGGTYTFKWSTGASSTGISSTIKNLCDGTYTVTVKDDSGCSGTASVIITEPPALNISTTQVNVKCFGVPTGSINTTVSGGTPAYTYKWTPGGQTTANITGLSAGTYKVLVTDSHGCKDSATIIITQPPVLTASITSSVNVKCNAVATGSITVTAGGGTPAYNYVWSPSGGSGNTASNLSAGCYTVTVTDANGCTVTASACITQPTAIRDSVVSITNVKCFGKSTGSINIGVKGGTPAYIYSWSPSGETTDPATNLAAGTYTLTITDKNGCTATISATITQPTQLTATISSQVNVDCNGKDDGSATVTAGGGTPAYTYAWAPVGGTGTTASNLSAGCYTVTVTDANACTVTASVCITQPANPLKVTLTGVPNPLPCFNKCIATISTTVSGGTAAYGYVWSTGATSAVLTNQCAGSYTVTVTDAHGCTATASIIISQPPQLRDSITATTNIKCNGFSTGSATVGVKGGTPAYTYAWTTIPVQTNITATGLSAGCYTVTVTDKNGCNVTASVCITQPPPISLTMTNTGEKCNGDINGTATVSASGGTPGYVYVWAPGGKTTTTITGLSVGCYTVTVKDANGCTATATTCITEPTPLTAIITATTSTCGKCDGSAKVAAGGGTAPYNYSWNPTGQTSDSATGLCVGNYTVTVTDANGCTATAKAVIVPTVKIVITTSGSTVSCDSSCDGIASANPSGGLPPYLYSWAPGGQTGQNATGLCAGSYTVTVTDKNGCTSIDSTSIANPPKLKVTTTQINVTCVGKCNGSATATASGGTGAYTYSWSNGATTSSIVSLCIGTYTITVTDNNGCKDSAIVNITSGGSISPNPTTVDPLCNKSNGSITLAPTGGTAPYTYAWAPPVSTTAIATGLSAGTYTVTITDATGCNQTFFILLNNASGPTLSVSNIAATCADTCDGTGSVTVTAGVGPYNYVWTTGATTTTITGLCPGVYVCTVTDANGCISNISDTIKKPVPISPNATIQDISCNNGGSTGKITLAPTGGTAPYTYSWAPAVSTTSSASGLSAGTYNIDIKDNVGCDTLISINITEPPVLVVTITSTNVTCNTFKNGSATAIVSGGTPPYIYNWSNGAVTPTATNLGPGTYTVTVTDGFGCQATASVTITQPPPITDVIKAINESCALSSDGGAVSTPSGGTPPYTYAWSNGQTKDSLQNVSPGTYYLTITDAHGCTYTDSVKITAPPPIVITFSSQNDFCNGECNGTATANASGGTPAYTYSWNTIPVQTNQTATGLCAGAYVVTVTDANGCISSNSITITQPPALNANPSATPTTCSLACNGTASSSPTGGTPPYTYKWSNGQTSSTINALCHGIDTVIVTDKNGCMDTGIITVPNPTPFSITATTAASNCNSSDGSITVIPSGGSPAYTYLWTPGGQTTSNITGLSAGIYTVKVTDSKGCDSSFAVLLNNSGGVSSFTNVKTGELCFGDSNAYIVATPSGGTTPYTYFWANLPAPNGQATDSIYTLTAGTYTLQVTDNNGCIQFDTVSIVQPPKLSATAVIANATCAGVCTGSITLTASGGTPPYTYDWSNGATTALITGLCPGSYSDTITDADGCSIVQTYVVGTNSGITVTTTITGTILCNGGSTANATANAIGGGGIYTYSWAPGAQTNQTATNLSAGTYTVTVKDQNGCVGIDSATITQPPAIVITQNVTPITCNNSCDGQIVLAPSGGTPPYTYHWSNGNTSNTLSSLCFGKYVDTVKDANGCVAIDSVTLINPPVFTETHIESNASCNTTDDGSISLIVSGGIPPYTYSWAPPVSTSANASNLSIGTYTITIKDSTGCTIIDSVTVLSDTTVLAKAGNDTGFCIGTPFITLNGSKSLNSITYQWFQLPGMIPLGNTAIITIPAPGSTTTYELVTMDGSCSDTAKVTITVNPLPVVDAGPTKTIFIYFSTTIGGSPTGPVGSTYSWQPPNGLNDTAIANPVASPTVTTTYTVTVTNANGCSASDTVTVFVLPQIIIPSGFTPNGDGQNDVWNIKNINQFPNAEVEIFNRWGEQLFVSVGYKTPWDGSYNNNPLPVGTYYYIVDLHDPRFPKAYTGPVTIMR